jgi:hypothetical protein
VSKLAAKLTSGGVLAGLVCAGVTMGSAFGAETATVPNFAPNSATGWLAQDDEFIAPPSGPGPVMSDPTHPYISFYKFRANPNPMFRVADLGNPILQPWAREQLKKVNERALSGKCLFPRSGAGRWAFPPSWFCRQRRFFSSRPRPRS